MYSSEKVTERAFSALADNLVVLRYVQHPGKIRPTVTVVKTRASAHDYGTFGYAIGSGGIRIGTRAGAAKRARARKSLRPKR